MLTQNNIQDSFIQTPEHYFNQLNNSINNTADNLFSVLWYESTAQWLFNKAYFSSTDTISDTLLASLSQKAQYQIDELNIIIHDIHNISALNTAQKDLFLKRIEKAILKLQYHQHAMYLEAEKAWFSLDEKEKFYHNQEKLRIEEALYGPSILFRPERMEQIGKKLYQLFEGNKHKLSWEDQLFWEKHILSHFTPQYTRINSEEQSDQAVFIHENTIFPLVELVLQLQGFAKDDLIKVQLSDDPLLTEAWKQWDIYMIPSRWSAKEQSNFFREQWLEDKFKIVKRTSWTNSVLISTTKHQINLWAPKDGKYNLKDSVLPVIFDHEVATHVNTWIGNLHNQKLYDSTRGDLEEWIAILNERIWKGQSLEDIYEASTGDITQFLGEVCTDEELRQAIHIYFALSGNTGNVEDRLRRIRRGVAVGEKGSNRKDLTYGNSKEILKELEELTKTPEGITKLNTYAKAIYSTKLWYDALSNLEQVLEWIKNIEELEPNFPIFAWKILYWKLFKGKLDKDEMLRTDIRNIIETNQEVSYTQKKLLVQLKQLIESDEEYQKRFEKQTLWPK